MFPLPDFVDHGYALVMPSFQIQWRRRASAMLSIILVASLTACRLIGAGGCEHTYRDPVLEITHAFDAATGRRVALVYLTGLSVQDQSFPITYLLASSRGATAKGDTLICAIPCAFGTAEGRYAFTVSADGHVTQARTVQARFGDFHGGCPSWNSGSTKLLVRLSPAGSASVEQ